MTSYVIAIANEKGGVAKTTTALSLGGALVEQQYNVLLVDLDPLSNLTLALGYKSKHLELTMGDILLSDQSIHSAIVQTALPNLDLVPANADLALTERFMVVRENYEQLLKGILNSNESHDIVLLDCPPALGPLTYNALSAADLLLIPTQCEFYSAHSLRNMLSMIRNVRERTNPELRYRLVLTMFDKRNRIHSDLHDQIRRVFGDAVFNSVIEIDTKLRESPILNQPITTYAPNSRGSEQYRQLAEELRQYIHETVGSPTRSA
jgi:chromosome partitioning protein